MELTEEQRRAVEFDGSIAVTAGAGTGKTAMLTRRFLHHVFADGMSPLEVVAVTFTRKAAAELRSRIREEISREGTSQQAAEVDAAQISTIHSLAAKICRDFHDLAGIPADFAVMDDHETVLRAAEWHREAIGQIDAEIVRELGFSWLSAAFRRLLSDPLSSREALAVGGAAWEEALAKARESAIAELTSSPEWACALGVLERYSGAADDKLEGFRRAALASMAAIETGVFDKRTFGCFTRFSTGLGAKGKWKDGGLEEMRACLGGLRDRFRECAEIAFLEYGDDEAELERRIALLRIAFERAFSYIEQEKKAAHRLDHSDLEIYALKILEHEEPRTHYAERWKAFLIDEFQDTNPTQARLLRLLDRHAKTTIVGDEKQSIYRFRGADVDVFRAVRDSIGNEIALTQSFRSSGPLVEDMNTAFRSLLGGMSQDLNAVRSESASGEVPFRTLIVGKDQGADSAALRSIEAERVAAEISRLVNSGVEIFDKRTKAARPVAFADIAILSAVRAPLELYVDALTARGIPAINNGGGKLLETRAALDTLAAIFFAEDRHDDIALLTLLRSPFFAVSDRSLFAAARGRPKETSWWQTISSDPQFAAVSRLLSEILDLSSVLSPLDLVRRLDEMTGYGAILAAMPQGRRRLADRDGVYALLRLLASSGRGDLTGTARYIRLLIESEAEIPSPPVDAGNAVTLMTIHGSKGLEWPVVFVIDIARAGKKDKENLTIDRELGVAFELERRVEGTSTGAIVDLEKVDPSILALMKRRLKRQETEEEKRKMYVAVTRARDLVYATASLGRGCREATLAAFGMAGLPTENVDRETIAPRTAADISRVKAASTALIEQTVAVRSGLAAIPVTGLSDYAVCPKRFEFQYVKGHPGVGIGFARAREVGVLTHLALELGIASADELKRYASGSNDGLAEEAYGLARRFWDEDVFAHLRNGLLRKEVKLRFEVNGCTLSGVADLVGEDLVLDYKTDSVMQPEHHKFQLWAYASFFEKPRAVIAYLRHGEVYEFSAAEIEEAGRQAGEFILGITSGDFPSRPSEASCAACGYSAICEDGPTRRD